MSDQRWDLTTQHGRSCDHGCWIMWLWVVDHVTEGGRSCDHGCWIMWPWVLDHMTMGAGSCDLSWSFFYISPRGSCWWVHLLRSRSVPLIPTVSEERYMYVCAWDNTVVPYYWYCSANDECWGLDPVAEGHQEPGYDVEARERGYFLPGLGFMFLGPHSAFCCLQQDGSLGRASWG